MVVKAVAAGSNMRTVAMATEGCPDVHYKAGP